MRTLPTIVEIFPIIEQTISKILRKFDEYFRFFCEYSVRQWYNFVVVQLRSGAVVQFTCSSGAVVQLRSGEVVQFTCSSGAIY